MALELAVHLDPRIAEVQDVELVDGQDRGGYGRFVDCGCVDGPVVSLLGGVGHVVGDTLSSAMLSLSELSSSEVRRACRRVVTGIRLWIDCGRVVVGTCYGTM